jgi:hypothetical protein
MKKGNVVTNPLQIHADASKMYGRGLWDKMTLIAEGAVANDYAKPLALDTDPRTLAGPAMYWVKNKFGDVQLVIKYAQDGWAYAAPVKDKDGDPVLADANRYQVHEVKAKSTSVFTIDDRTITIEKGFTTLKAYAID